MVTPARTWSTLLLACAIVVLPAGAAAAAAGAAPPAAGAAAPAASAAAQDGPGSPACAATGHLVGSVEELSALRSQLYEEPVHIAQGVPLERVETWVVPSDRLPVVVVDSAGPVSGGEVRLTLGGVTYPAVAEDFAQPRDRYVTNVLLPHLGPVVRTVGLTVATDGCESAVVLRADRSLWSTWVGSGAVAVSALAGLLTVLVARRRSGGWARRFGWAAPLGVLAGTAQAAVWYEAGLLSPFAAFPVWWPLAGLGLAALLPLTRRRVRAAAGPADAWSRPSHAPLADLTPVGGFARTEVAEVHRVVSPDGTPALAKVPAANRRGEPATRLRLVRESRVLSDLAHPHLPRLRQTVTGDGDGPPTLVFENVTGPPLARIATALSGPQAVNVALAVLAGLAALHARELVHRDVRPENIWLDRDGGVVLANLEVAAPGVEHPVAPEVGPYASPEQRRGEVLDGRSDVWSCAAVLRELLPEPPAPVAELLSRALAEDRGARPGSAELFAAELRQAAEAAYGPDWVGRGALGAALTAHGAVGAATIGYAAAGAGGAAGAAGVAGGAGAAGAGTAAGMGGAAGGATAGAAGLGTAAGASVVDASVAGWSVASGGAAGVGGKVAALVNPGIAIVAGVAAVAAAVVVDAPPAEARTPVVTPEQAQVIVVRTLAEGRAGEYAHIQPGPPRDALDALVDQDDELATAPVTAVAVGVPAEQYAFPAYFVATGEIPYDGGLVSWFARFDRSAGDQPWLLTLLVWSVDEALAAPALDDDGWLAAPPAEPSIPPEELAARYVEWHDRRWGYKAEELGPEQIEDDLYRLREAPSSYLLSLLEWNEEERVSGAEVRTPPRSVPADRVEDGRRFFTYTAVSEVFPEPAEVSTLPLADGTVLVSFQLTAHRTTTNVQDGRSGPCDVRPDFRLGGVRYRILAADFEIRILVWLPPEGDPATAVPIADPVVSMALPSDRSVRC